MASKLPGNQSARLNVPQQQDGCRLLEIFTDIVQLAAQVCATPTALIYLADGTRQGFQSAKDKDIDILSLPADDAVWTQVLQPEPLVVQDMSQDSRFANSLFVTSDLPIHFYAGVPLLAFEGQVAGTLCVFDRVPRQLNSEQVEALKTLARQAIASLELHQRAADPSQLPAALKHHPHPVLVSNAKGQVIDVNRATEQALLQLGLDLTAGWLPLDHSQIVRTCLERRQHHRQVEVRVQNQIFSWTYYPMPGADVVYSYAFDITAYKQTEEQLLHNAFHDVLTGLPNRALFMERMRYVVERAKRYKDYLFAILFLDLDRFKIVNDSLGHMIGDRLLIEIARRLETCLRSGDTVARLGGDEFAILLESIRDVGDATNVAKRIHKALVPPFNLGGHEVFTTFSIGIALSSMGYDHPETLLRDADTAMYRAKAVGRGCHAVFDTVMHTQAVALLQLENDLRRAIERQEFRILYQPIIALDTGRIAGFEALVRWQHPEQGLLSPGAFIPTAEETRLILPIGQWALQQACQQMSHWQKQFAAYPPLTISVNLSGKQLSQPDLIEQIDQTLEDTGLETGSLKLEITESMLMDNAESARVLLGQLRARNIQLSIDDFGTGYSSLSYLRRFPLNTLKIDRSFISKMGIDDENAEIVRTIVTLAHNLGIYVTAEGVETEAQLVQLWALQCEYAQGYFFSRPLDSKAAEALLTAAPQW